MIRQANAKSYGELFEFGYGMSVMLKQAKDVMGPGCDGVMQHLANVNAACKKKKGFMGAIGCLLVFDEISDMVMVKVPALEHLKSRIYMWDWRSNPVSNQFMIRDDYLKLIYHQAMYLNTALKNRTSIPDPLVAPVMWSTVDAGGNVVPAEVKPVRYDEGVRYVDDILKDKAKKK